MNTNNTLQDEIRVINENPPHVLLIGKQKYIRNTFWDNMWKSIMNLAMLSIVIILIMISYVYGISNGFDLGESVSKIGDEKVWKYTTLEKQRLYEMVVRQELSPDELQWVLQAKTPMTHLRMLGLNEVLNELPE